MSLIKYLQGVALAVCCGVLVTGCIGKKAVVPSDQAGNESASLLDDADHGCSYFYFLWARHAELAAQYNEALEAYEKTLICDPASELAERKVSELLFRLGRIDEAVRQVELFLESHPKDKESRMLLAKLYLRQGHFQEATEQYRQVHMLYPQDTTALLMLSELYLTWNRPERAVDTLKQLLEIDNESYPAHVLFARLLAVKKDFDKAVRHYRLALDTKWSAGLQLEMAEIFLQQKKYTGAIQLYKDILGHDDRNEDARIALVHVYLLQNKETLALEELTRLKALAVKTERVDLTIARLFARRKKYDKAISVLEDMLKKADNSEAKYLLAVIYFQTSQLPKALLTVEGIDRDAEEYDEAVFLQVRILRELKQEEKAIALLESTLSDERIRTPEMFALLANLYRNAEKIELGRKTFARALKVYPDNGKLLYAYGLFLDYSGDQEQALTVMQKVIKLQPEHAGALNYVGYTWAEKSVHLKQALAYIQRAVKLKPDNGYIHDSLGWIYYRLGKQADAIITLRQAIELTPDDPTMYEHLAEVYIAAGQQKNALQVYRQAYDLSKDEKDRKRIEKIINLIQNQDNK